MRAQCVKVWDETGNKPPELDTPPCPASLAYLWEHYCDVGSGEILSFSELQAWSSLLQIKLSAFDVRQLRKLSGIHLSVINDG